MKTRLLQQAIGMLALSLGAAMPAASGNDPCRYCYEQYEACVAASGGAPTSVCNREYYDCLRGWGCPIP